MISKYKKLNNKYVGIYFLFCAILFTYLIHSPFTYLTKKWFWQEPPSVKNINQILTYLPPTASVVSQNNISSHISNRMNIFTLWPEQKNFKPVSPCGKPICTWFRWSGNPNYLVVDTSDSWDARWFLTNREDFINGLKNMEKEKIITVFKKSGTAVLYRILKRPDR